MTSSNPPSRDVMDLMNKIADPDPDIRYMSLNDLKLLLDSSASISLFHEKEPCECILRGLLKAFADQNPEVQNQALKCLKPAVLRMNFEAVGPFVASLTKMSTDQAVDTSIPNTALRMLMPILPEVPVVMLRAPVSRERAESVISRIVVPSLVGQTADGSHYPVCMLAKIPGRGYNTDAIDVAIEVLKTFAHTLIPEEVLLLKDKLVDIIGDDSAGNAVQKRACIAIATLASTFTDKELSELVADFARRFESPDTSITYQRNIISTIGSMAQPIPRQVRECIDQLVPLVLSAFQRQAGEDANDQFDELYETSLISLEALFNTCPSSMGQYINPITNATLALLKHDPNLAEMDDDDIQMQDEDEEEAAANHNDEDFEFEDFEEEEGYSDVDDASWKVRRCAAKLLHSIISQYSAKTKPGAVRVVDEAIVFRQIAPALLARMTREREESVKVEVVLCLRHLVHQTAESTDAAESVRISRKRRRRDSDVSGDGVDSILDSPMTTDAPIISPSTPMLAAHPIIMEVTKLTNEVLQNTLKIWKNASVTLKHAALSLLQAFTTARTSAFSESLPQLQHPILDSLKAASTASTSISSLGVPGAMSVSYVDLQIVALSLVTAISETHSSSSLIPFLIAIVPETTVSVSTRIHYKIASEAFITIEAIIKALTPPRISPTNAQNQDIYSQLDTLHRAVVACIKDNSFDSEVRRRAINALGVLLARTSGPHATRAVSPEQRSGSLDLLYEKIKQESSRLPVVVAVYEISRVVSHDNELSKEWIRNVTVELSAQLRKYDRALRGSSLDALRSMMRNAHIRPHIIEDSSVVKTLATDLLPLMDADDFHLLTPCLFIMTVILPGNTQNVDTRSLIERLCLLIKPSLVGSTLKLYLSLVRIVAEQGAGANLMQAYLQDVGVDGDPEVLGRSIGTLLLSGGPDIGYKIDDFLKELREVPDVRRKCLSLAVLGEYGLHMGPRASSLLSPETFISNFHTRSDKLKLAAAFGLGSCATGNVPNYLPLIIEGLENSAEHRYLLLHSLREVLQHVDAVKQDLVPFVDRLWGIIIPVSNSDETRPVGSECLGRLACMNPAVYIPILQNSLGHDDAQIRATIICTLRFTLADGSESYITALRPVLVPALLTMLHDAELSNHQLALTTLKYAIHHKPEIVIPGFGDIFPVLIQDTHVRPELVTTVRMGPFRHQVDDGLEMRKSAYEALYSCLDYITTSSAPDTNEIFSRLIDGIHDDPDIQTLCGLMIQKFTTLDPPATRAHLNTMALAFRKVLANKPKPAAVKQEHEKAKQAATVVLRITEDLRAAFPDTEPPVHSRTADEFGDWHDYLSTTMREEGGLV